VAGYLALLPAARGDSWVGKAVLTKNDVAKLTEMAYTVEKEEGDRIRVRYRGGRCGWPRPTP
jgi:hypothetical protein